MLYRIPGPWPLLCIPTSPSYSKGSIQVSLRGNTVNLGGPVLAQEAMVYNTSQIIRQNPLDVTPQEGSSFAGPSGISTDRHTETSSMATEEEILKNKGLSERVIRTLIQSCKPVTRAIYGKIWKKFNGWLSNRTDASRGSANILEFLQDGVDWGLSLSTIKVQIAALGVYLQKSLQEDLLISRFCKAIAKSTPIQRHKIPTWDLVLRAFLRAPFEAIAEASLRLLTLKTVLLITITSACRVGEMQAFSVRGSFLQILDDRVI